MLELPLEFLLEQLSSCPLEHLLEFLLVLLSVQWLELPLASQLVLQHLKVQFTAIM